MVAAPGYLSVEVWPENWPAFALFCELQTQWRTGALGSTGLDYNVLFHKLDRMNLTPDDYAEWENDIRTLELEALAVMNEKDD